MSAILSADDLNDFISPGVACIKPVETLPKQAPGGLTGYEVTKEGTAPEDNKPAQISLTDCLACSGCVTSAEAVLISLQSHTEVLSNLDDPRGRIFVASVSPQVRASLAATYGVDERKAGWMIEQLLCGHKGLPSNDPAGRVFRWVLDTNTLREAILTLGAEELSTSSRLSKESEKGDGTSASETPKKPVLTSACPGWVCYAEKTHPHVLKHLSRLKSPQALTGVLLKTVLSRRLGISPDQIWHLAIMPCFDKKLEASREELTDVYWDNDASQTSRPPVRDVDCVITTRELIMLADSRGISFPNLPQQPVRDIDPFPDPVFASAFFPPSYYKTRKRLKSQQQDQKPAGSSGGYLHQILQTELHLHPGSTLKTIRGRNDDVIEYTIHPVSYPPTTTPNTDPVFKAARYYGFRNIQNIVRKLKPPKPSRMPLSNRPIPSGSAKIPTRKGGTLQRPNPASTSATDYDYVEIMACPGGCTNGGGQIKIDDLPAQSPFAVSSAEKISQKEWLARVDEAYFSMSSDEGEAETDDGDDGDVDMLDADTATDTADGSREGDVYINDINTSHVHRLLDHWASVTGIPLEKLVNTSFRRVESDVGKTSMSGGANAEGGGEVDQARVLEAASRW